MAREQRITNPLRMRFPRFSAERLDNRPGVSQNEDMDAVTLQKLFIANVERLLGELELTRSGLSREMKVSPSYITEYLSGRLSPGLDVIAKFAKGLKVAPVELLMTKAQVEAFHADAILH